MKNRRYVQVRLDDNRKRNIFEDVLSFVKMMVDAGTVSGVNYRFDRLYDGCNYGIIVWHGSEGSQEMVNEYMEEMGV